MPCIPALGRVIGREEGQNGITYLTIEWIDDEGYRVSGDFKWIASDILTPFTPRSRIPKRGRILEMSEDETGRYFEVIFVDRNGRPVRGSFKLIGWGDPPREVAEEVHRILSNPPTALYGRFNQKRGKE